MPRIAAALAVLGTVAFCIGFNTVRYPAVWEMLRRVGSPPAAAQPADALAKHQPQPTPSTEPKEEIEFCTADGICYLAGGRQIVHQPELPAASCSVGVSPAPSCGGQTDATPRKAETPASSRAGQIPAASRAGETPAPQPDAKNGVMPAPAMPTLAVGMSEPANAANAAAPSTAPKRRLVPVNDDPPVAPVLGLAPLPTGPATDKNPRPPAGSGVRPLPAVDEADAANAVNIPPLPGQRFAAVLSLHRISEGPCHRALPRIRTIPCLRPRGRGQAGRGRAAVSAAGHGRGRGLRGDRNRPLSADAGAVVVDRRGRAWCSWLGLRSAGGIARPE